MELIHFTFKIAFKKYLEYYKRVTLTQYLNKKNNLIIKPR